MYYVLSKQSFETNWDLKECQTLDEVRDRILADVKHGSEIKLARQVSYIIEARILDGEDTGKPAAPISSPPEPERAPDAATPPGDRSGSLPPEAPWTDPEKTVSGRKRQTA